MPLEFCCYHLHKLRCTLFHIHVRLQAAMSDFSLISTIDSVYISPVVLLDIKSIYLYNHWNFVVIMYTSWDTLYFKSTSGYKSSSFISYSPDLRQCWDQYSRVAWHRKYGYSRWNFVAIMYTSWNICYFISTSGCRPPSLVYYSPWRRRVFALDLPCFWT